MLITLVCPDGNENAIFQMEKTLESPYNGDKGGRPKVSLDYHFIKECVEAGLSDEQIGEFYDCSYKTISNYRKYNGLVSGACRGGKREGSGKEVLLNRTHVEYVTSCITQYCMSNKAIGELLGCKRDTVRLFRRNHYIDKRIEDRVIGIYNNVPEITIEELACTTGYCLRFIKRTLIRNRVYRGYLRTKRSGDDMLSQHDRDAWFLSREIIEENAECRRPRTYYSGRGSGKKGKGGGTKNVGSYRAYQAQKGQ